MKTPTTSVNALGTPTRSTDSLDFLLRTNERTNERRIVVATDIDLTFRNARARVGRIIKLVDDAIGSQR